MALFGPVSTLRAQAPLTPGFQAAFSHIDELLRAGSPAANRLQGMSRGAVEKIELGAGALAINQVYDTKPRNEGFFESHRKFIDVQLIFEGEEVMEVVDASRMTVRQPYSAERDVILYVDTAGTSHLRLSAGDAAIFFPADVHMPSLRAGPTASMVRKCVVKVPVG